MRHRLSARKSAPAEAAQTQLSAARSRARAQQQNASPEHTRYPPAFAKTYFADDKLQGLKPKTQDRGAAAPLPIVTKESIQLSCCYLNLHALGAVDVVDGVENGRFTQRQKRPGLGSRGSQDRRCR